MPRELDLRSRRLRSLLAAFEAVGSHFTLYEPDQGHTITPAQVLQQYSDLKGSTSP
jgi:hypothetical protein